jgi:hypothetical protein
MELLSFVLKDFKKGKQKASLFLCLFANVLLFKRVHIGQNVEKAYSYSIGHRAKIRIKLM